MSLIDQDAVRAVRLGDRNAFGQLVRAHQHRLFGLVLMIVHQRTGADEITQDAFVRAYTHLAQYDDTRPFYPWLASIAVRLSQNWLRQNGRTLAREGTSFSETTEPIEAGNALAALIANERQHRLWEAVAALPSGERAAVVLFYRDEMGISDVARTLGVTTGTVKTLLFRARRHLRERASLDQLRGEKAS